MKLYTSKTCAYCKQVKEELDKNNLVYKEISIEDNETEWINVFELTGYPTVHTTCTWLLVEQINC
jgi:glutaredoxin